MLLGNLFEHYDSALFSMLSPFLAPLFFPHEDFLTALILTYCIIPLGMIARPIGSLVFGYIGDCRGRREALFLSLSGIAIITGLIGFLPTYDQAGIWAPILLSIGRLIQNFFLAGETMGGAIYLIENSPENEKNILSSFYSASTIGGILLASCGVSILCILNIVQTHWRILYFLGCTTAAVIVFLRAKVPLKLYTPGKQVDPFLIGCNSGAAAFFSPAISSENACPQFRAFETSRSTLIYPTNEFSEISFKWILKNCWEKRQALASIAVASGFSYASYTISLVMMNSFVPLVTAISQTEMMHLNTFLLIADFLLLPAFGLLANKFSREIMMVSSGILALISGLPLFWLLEGASLLFVIVIRLAIVTIGIWFAAPFHAWSQTLVPPACRYTIISFGYALGSQIFGGPTAAISLWLFKQTNWPASAGCYWMFLGLFASYFVSKKKSI